MRIQPANPRGGFTLMEMLIYLIVLGVCVALGTALLTTAMSADRTGATGANRVARIQELGRLFRADVSRASAAANQFENLKAGRDRLVLQMPDGLIIVYLWDDQVLERVERKGNFEARRTIAVGPAGTAVEFSQSEKVIALHLAEPSRHGPSKRTELSAALGGNQR